MATEKLSVVTEVPVTPEQLYAAWLDSKLHSAMTGGRATVVARVGGRHTAWNGYIEGDIVDLQAGLRIVQRWRTKDFPVEAPPSRVEITFLPVAGGTRVALFQSDIPEGQAARYEIGWEQNYFAPMRAYFRQWASGTQPKESPKPSAKLKKPKARVAAKARSGAKASGRAKPTRASKTRRGVKAKPRDSMKSRRAVKVRRRAVKSRRKRRK